MKLFRFAYLTLAQAGYRWALREIDPMHPDVPGIVLRQRELQDAARRLFA